MRNVPRIVVYDAEIKRAILMDGETIIPGIEYCEGWSDYHGMGISVLVAWDSKYNRYRIFDDNSKHKFDRLVQKADYLIGYQSIRFDNPLIQACWRIHMPVDKVLDIKEAMMAKEEMPTSDHKIILYKALSLNRAAKCNGLYPKLMHGSMAPVLWQQGHFAEVADYCSHDTELVVQLVEKSVLGDLKSPITEEPYKGQLLPPNITKVFTK